MTIISQHINWYVFVIEMQHVFYEVKTEFLNTA